MSNRVLRSRRPFSVVAKAMRHLAVLAYFNVLGLAIAVTGGINAVAAEPKASAAQPAVGQPVVGVPAAPLPPGRDVNIGSRVLRIPEGFEIELVAGPPLVDRPISIARDELGRLYATDSAGMSDRAPVQLEKKPHRIVRLEDIDGDGKYDTSTVFADRMMFPEGAMWHDGSLYVAAPPQIWKLTDEDGDGKAEKREVWYDGKTLTGCANDLHGPYLGVDGWFYWCKGAFDEQKHTLPNGKPFVTRSSHIFRARPDGTGFEPVLTGGMDNPVNVAFHSTGERFLSCTFFQFPEAGRRDGLIHAIYGGVYGKKHDSIYAHPMTGDVMPVLTHQGAAAPCGLTSGNDALFGGGYRDQLFACYFNLHKVVRHELVPNGPTFTTKDTDMVSCDHPDFHPTDVQVDADGSLLVVDTGGWYKVCCPTSQIAKPDVLGGIYRIRKTGTKPPADPLGLKLDWAKPSLNELTARLADPRPFVQQRATRDLRKAGAAAVPALAEALGHADQSVRLRAVWTLAGIDVPLARQVNRMMLDSADGSALRAAIHAAGLNRDAESLPLLLEHLRSDDVAIARPAAEAIGRLASAKAVPEILKCLERGKPFTADASGAPADDARRVTEHALIYALIEIGHVDSTSAGLASPSANVRRGALVALDQMSPAALKPGQVIPLLDHPDPTLKNTASWIIGHRPDWGTELVAALRERIGRPTLSDAERAQLASQLATLAKSPVIQELLAVTLKEMTSEPSQQVVLKAMADAKLPVTPLAWLDQLATGLGRFQGATLAQAVATARVLPLPKGGHEAMKKALLAVGKAKGPTVEVRFQALTAAGNVGALEPELFRELTARALPAESLELRSAATGILATATLSSDQRTALLETLKEVGPLELPRLLAAYEREPTEKQGLELAQAISEASGFRSLRPDHLQPLFAKYPKKAQEASAQLIAVLNRAAAEQAALLEKVQAELPAGDVRRGHEVFVGRKASCIACHAVGYLGGKLGPDLTNIGKVRNDRDLIESIVFPSSSFVRSYESVVVELEDGRVHAGIVIRETSDELVLATGPQETRPISRRDVAEIHPSKVSLMPQGYVTLLSRQELADLLAYLKTPR